MVHFIKYLRLHFWSLLAFTFFFYIQILIFIQENFYEPIFDRLDDFINVHILNRLEIIPVLISAIIISSIGIFIWYNIRKKWLFWILYSLINIVFLVYSFRPRMVLF